MGGGNGGAAGSKKTKSLASGGGFKLNMDSAVDQLDSEFEKF